MPFLGREVRSKGGCFSMAMVEIVGEAFPEGPGQEIFTLQTCL